MKKSIAIFISLLVLIPNVLAGAREDFSNAKSWGIQLENINIDQLIKTDFDILVIDYSSDGTENGEFTKEEIQKLKDSGKTVLAYISLGEAEIYRFYWKAEWESTTVNQQCMERYWNKNDREYQTRNNCPFGKAPFIGWENPNYHGRYIVKYWYPLWWDQALKPYIDKVMENGFDGIYLDNINVYEEWAGKEYNIKSLAVRMIQLFGKIKNYVSVEKKNKDFLIVQQNDDSLLGNISANDKRKYFMWIDGIGVESLIYDTDWKTRIIRTRNLKTFADNGKKILNIEYLVNNSTVSKYLQFLKNINFEILPYRAQDDGELNEIMPSLKIN